MSELPRVELQALLISIVVAPAPPHSFKKASTRCNFLEEASAAAWNDLRAGSSSCVVISVLVQFKKFIFVTKPLITQGEMNYNKIISLFI